MKRFYRIVRAIVKPFAWAALGLRVQGLENIPPSGRIIICPNHTSFADPVILIIALRRQIFFMAKSEFFKSTALSWFFKKLGVFPVCRNKADPAALDRAQELLADEEVVGIFIEGTRSKTGEYLKPKSGAALIAFNAKSPIVPVCICGEGGGPVRIFRKNLLRIGKPIFPDELGVTNFSAKELREASRLVMSLIKGLGPAGEKTT